MNHLVLLLAYVHAQSSVGTVFGSPVKPPGPAWSNPVEGLTTIIIWGIRMVLLVGIITVLVFLLWGAYDWITGGGDQEKLDKARSKLTNAVLGIVLMIVALGVFFTVSGDVLGILRRGSDGRWIFTLPAVSACVPSGGACSTKAGSAPCCGPNTCNLSSGDTSDGICAAP